MLRSPIIFNSTILYKGVRTIVIELTHTITYKFILIYWLPTYTYLHINYTYTIVYIHNSMEQYT